MSTNDNQQNFKNQFEGFEDINDGIDKPTSSRITPNINVPNIMNLQATWTCNICTFENETNPNTDKICDACGEPNETINQESRKPEAQTTWTCITCTCVNVKKLNTENFCDACGENQEYVQPDAQNKGEERQQQEQLKNDNVSNIKNLPTTWICSTCTCQNVTQPNTDAICEACGTPNENIKTEGNTNNLKPIWICVACTSENVTIPNTDPICDRCGTPNNNVRTTEPTRPKMKKVTSNNTVPNQTFLNNNARATQSTRPKMTKIPKNNIGNYNQRNQAFDSMLVNHQQNEAFQMLNPINSDIQQNKTDKFKDLHEVAKPKMVKTQNRSGKVALLKKEKYVNHEIRLSIESNMARQNGEIDILYNWCEKRYEEDEFSAMAIMNPETDFIFLNFTPKNNRELEERFIWAKILIYNNIDKPVAYNFKMYEKQIKGLWIKPKKKGFIDAKSHLTQKIGFCPYDFLNKNMVEYNFVQITVPLKGDFLKFYNEKSEQMDENEWDEHLEAVDFLREHKANSGHNKVLRSCIMNLNHKQNS